MDNVHNSLDSKRSCFDRRANLILSVLLMLVVVVGGINIIALMMERGVSGIVSQDRISAMLERSIEKNSELTSRYDELIRKHGDIVRENFELTVRYRDLLGRYEVIIAKVAGDLHESRRQVGERQPK